MKNLGYDKPLYILPFDHRSSFELKTFGTSSPLKELQRKYGFEPEQVVAAAKQQLGRK